MKTSGHRSFEKYTSHFIERVVCERELETEQNCNILTPTLMAITALCLSRSPGLLNRGPRDPASLGNSPHSSIFSPTDSNPNCSIGSPEALPSAGCWFSLQHLISDSNFLCTKSYYCFTPTKFNLSTVKVISLRPSTGCTCYLHRCISYFDSSAGVNMQQTNSFFKKKVCSLTNPVPKQTLSHKQNFSLEHSCKIQLDSQYETR